jgi:hypothetical protein
MGERASDVEIELVEALEDIGDALGSKGIIRLALALRDL